jgi:hypothetical protein
MEVVGVTNPNGPANGLEVFDTALKLGLLGLMLWWLWRHPVSFFATLIGLMVWWEAESAGHPVWPWLIVALFVGVRQVGALVRWLTPGLRRDRGGL